MVPSVHDDAFFSGEGIFQKLMEGVATNRKPHLLRKQKRRKSGVCD